MGQGERILFTDRNLERKWYWVIADGGPEIEGAPELVPLLTIRNRKRGCRLIPIFTP